MRGPGAWRSVWDPYWREMAMISFEPTDEQRMLIQTVHAFA